MYILDCVSSSFVSIGDEKLPLNMASFGWVMILDQQNPGDLSEELKCSMPQSENVF